MKFHKYLMLLCLTIVSIITNAQDAKMGTDTTLTIKVFGTCEQCKDRIEQAVKIKGVKSGIWEIETNLLTLVYNEKQVSLDKIQNKILSAGHDLIDKKAKDIIYNALPECCKFRTENSGEDSNLVTKLKGIVLQENSKGKFEPLSNASVYWLGTNSGVVTDSIGVFEIPMHATSQRIVIGYTGFRSDTITVIHSNDLKIILAAKGQLNEVTVFSRQLGSFIPYLNPIRTQVMTGAELLKAACCNLSESFETNPSVDVSYNDAVTGSKQIQLLGLSGNYTQITIENLPGPRGFATPLGLNSIAGPWIESIQLTKGVGSVANGFESIAGQINVELKKPETAERLLGNVYMNNIGKTDINLNLSTKLNSKWATALLLHDDFLQNAVDMNNDGFKDLPTGNTFSAINRYKYDNSKGTIAQFGFKILQDNKIGGETNFNTSIDKLNQNQYGLSINTERMEFFGKLGYVFPQQKYKSIGFQITAIDNQQDSYFGRTDYNSKQQSFYSNLIYQSILSSTMHKFRTGLSMQYDAYKEHLNNTPYTRKEVVPGAFFEYTYTPNEQWTLVAGMRADNNNIYGSYITPRFNLRYEPIKGTVVRASVGKGQRTANIFAENNTVFVSARQMSITPSFLGGAYGLGQEIAWNKGISVDQKLTLFGNTASLAFDYFRNDFNNQVIVDMEQARYVQFYNLQGRSYSHSFQAELNVMPLKRVDLKMAYRYFDVEQTYNGILLERPFIAKNRAFFSVDYASSSNWKFNYTLTYNGKKRITNTAMNPPNYQLAKYSPTYFLMNAQISKTFGKKYPMDLYVGAENITDYFQPNTVLAANAPFSPYFDATMIWGPTSGRMLYVGWRLKIK